MAVVLKTTTLADGCEIFIGTWRSAPLSVVVSATSAQVLTDQRLNDSLPNTPYHQVLTRATGTKNPRAKDVRYAVNRRVVGSNPT